MTAQRRQPEEPTPARSTCRGLAPQLLVRGGKRAVPALSTCPGLAPQRGKANGTLTEKTFRLAEALAASGTAKSPERGAAPLERALISPMSVPVNLLAPGARCQRPPAPMAASPCAADRRATASRDARVDLHNQDDGRIDRHGRRPPISRATPTDEPARAERLAWICAIKMTAASTGAGADASISRATPRDEPRGTGGFAQSRRRRRINEHGRMRVHGRAIRSGRNEPSPSPSGAPAVRVVNSCGPPRRVVATPMREGAPATAMMTSGAATTSVRPDLASTTRIVDALALARTVRRKSSRLTAIQPTS